ncbi:MAG: NUDIX domain-containing protein [Acholeplasmataceae bacterium]|nr:NUDIX domain-containing protein [Acholeplasmataceae bacterium]
MKIIHYFDLKDYHIKDKVSKRVACRAIILQYPHLYMIQSDMYQDLKFPGGGQKPDESDEQTLIRETLEETGLTVIKESISPFGRVIEKQKSKTKKDTIFYMESKYYTCKVKDHIKEQNLDDYEKEFGYKLIKIHIDDAINQNLDILSKNIPEIRWVKRELKVLKYLRGKQ